MQARAPNSALASISLTSLAWRAMDMVGGIGGAVAFAKLAPASAWPGATSMETSVSCACTRSCASACAQGASVEGARSPALVLVRTACADTRMHTPSPAPCTRMLVRVRMRVRAPRARPRPLRVHANDPSRRAPPPPRTAPAVVPTPSPQACRSRRAQARTPTRGPRGPRRVRTGARMRRTAAAAPPARAGPDARTPPPHLAKHTLLQVTPPPPPPGSLAVRVLAHRPSPPAAAEARRGAARHGVVGRVRFSDARASAALNCDGSPSGASADGVRNQSPAGAPGSARGARPAAGRTRAGRRAGRGAERGPPRGQGSGRWPAGARARGARGARGAGGRPARAWCWRTLYSSSLPGMSQMYTYQYYMCNNHGRSKWYRRIRFDGGLAGGRCECGWGRSLERVPAGARASWTALARRRDPRGRTPSGDEQTRGAPRGGHRPAGYSFRVLSSHRILITISGALGARAKRAVNAAPVSLAAAAASAGCVRAQPLRWDPRRRVFHAHAASPPSPRRLLWSTARAVAEMLPPA